MAAAAQIRLIAELPVFRAHMIDVTLANDVATIEALTDHYRAQLGSDFCLVTDPAGRWLGQAGWPANARCAGARCWPASMKRARTDRDRAILTIDNQLYLVVFEPASFADEVLGTLVAGYRLDDGVARALAERHAHGRHVAGGAGHLRQQSPGAERADLTRVMAARRAPLQRRGTVASVRLGAGRVLRPGVFTRGSWRRPGAGLARPAGRLGAHRPVPAQDADPPAVDRTRVHS